MPYFPDSIMRPNTKNEKEDILGAQQVISAADFNKHDEEIIAIEKAIGIHRPQTYPPGFSCRGDIPGCAGENSNCIPNAYGIADAIKAVSGALDKVGDSCRTISGVVRNGRKITFPPDWKKTSLRTGIPDSTTTSTITLNSVRNMADSGYVTIINDVSARETFNDIASMTYEQWSYILPRKWLGSPDMLENRYYFPETQVLSNGTMLVVGGVFGTSTSPSPLESEIYNIATNTFSGCANQPATKKYRCKTAQVGGRVIACGGMAYNIGDQINSYFSGSNKADLYDPTNNSWTALPNMSIGRAGHCAIQISTTKVLVMGGYTTTGPTNPVASCEIYDINSNSWSSAASMTYPRASFSAIILDNGKVFVVGNSFGSGANTLSYEIYDPNSNTWTVGSTPRQINDSYLARLPDGKIFISNPSRFIVYDPVTNGFEGSTAQPYDLDIYPLNGFKCVGLADGTVLLLGGGPTGNLAFPYAISRIYSREGYMPAPGTSCTIPACPIGTWSDTVSPTIDRTSSYTAFGSSLATLTNGTTMVLGGNFSPGSTFNGSTLYNDPGNYGRKTEIFGFEAADLTRYPGNAINIADPLLPLVQQTKLYISNQATQVDADIGFGIMSSIGVGTKLRLVSRNHPEREIVYLVTSVDVHNIGGDYGYYPGSPYTAGFELGVQAFHGSPSARFDIAEMLKLSIVTDDVGFPTYSSLASQDSVVFNIDNNSTFADTPSSKAFGAGTNVEIIGYSGLDCANSKLLNVTRGCNGTTVTRHGIGDLVFKGIASFQVSPASLIGNSSLDGIECFLRSDGTVTLSTFLRQGSSLTNSTATGEQYALYQGLLILGEDPIRVFSATEVDDQCLSNIVIPLRCGDSGFESAPLITSGGSLFGTAGSSVSYAITASGSPYIFGATGLPGGLSLDAVTGIITGTINSVMAIDAAISATNDTGTGSKVLTITIVNPPPPTIYDMTLAFSANTYGSDGNTTPRPDVTFAVSSGSLPFGLALSTHSQVVSGITIQYGQSIVGISGTNISGTGYATLTINVSPQPSNQKILTFHPNTDKARAVGVATTLAPPNTMPIVSLPGFTQVPVGTPPFVRTFTWASNWDSNFIRNPGSNARPSWFQFYPITDAVPYPDSSHSESYQFLPSQIPELITTNAGQGRIYYWPRPLDAANPQGRTPFMQRLQYGRIDSLAPDCSQPWPDGRYVGAVAKITCTVANGPEFVSGFTNCSEHFLVVNNSATTMDLIPIVGSVAGTRIPRKVLGPRSPDRDSAFIPNGSFSSLYAWHDGESGWSSHPTAWITSFNVELYGPDRTAADPFWSETYTGRSI